MENNLFVLAYDFRQISTQFALFEFEHIFRRNSTNSTFFIVVVIVVVVGFTNKALECTAHAHQTANRTDICNTYQTILLQHTSTNHPSTPAAFKPDDCQFNSTQFIKILRLFFTFWYVVFGCVRLCSVVLCCVWLIIFQLHR